MDPKARKVVVVEHPLLPLCVKNMFAKVLFQNLQVREPRLVRVTCLTPTSERFPPCLLLRVMCLHCSRQGVSPGSSWTVVILKQQSYQSVPYPLQPAQPNLPYVGLLLPSPLPPPLYNSPRRLAPHLPSTRAPPPIRDLHPTSTQSLRSSSQRIGPSTRYTHPRPNPHRFINGND